MTSWSTWLQAHTHHGAECIMNVYGVTGWWFAHATPGAAPTTVPAEIVPGTTYLVGRGQTATFIATMPPELVATRLVPGAHPE